MNHDECPQAICYGGGKGACRPKVGTIPGQKAVTTVVENREQFTMHPIVDLNADWGPWHMIFGMATFTEGGLPDCFSRMSTGMISHTAHGVQNEKTLLNFYKEVLKWLKKPRMSARFGPWTVSFPVVFLEDGHASRFGLMVQKFRRENNIHSFMEPSKTSGGFQLLDQFFKVFHDRYTEGASMIRDCRGDVRAPPSHCQ
jgi:hypothetical protein